MDLFVAGLPADLDDEELKEIFGDYGKVTKAKVILDRGTGKSRCFGFVTMPVEEEAMGAIKRLQGAELDGHPLTVKPAKDKRKNRDRLPNQRANVNAQPKKPDR